MDLGFAVGALGVIILFHSIYSTIQYKTMLKFTEDEFSGPPMNVFMELSIGLVLCLWASLAVPAKFQSILPNSDENRIVSLPENLDFMIFNHRGRVVFPLEVATQLKK
ncbi:membrane magnesium transporter-like [Impatiens glandulifera]|uniref:membrane magnesium transporter-like n=1 Tax=Impatiens glandulifera TaxID=253017 RepID=UPI001FB0559A|nr:membrane magnesium transporter-like [Impatiens glandulifera]